MASSHYLTKLQAMIAARTVPDAFYFPADAVMQWSDAGQVLNLTPYIEKSTAFNLKDVWPAAINRYRYDGNIPGQGPIWALPKDVGPWDQPAFWELPFEWDLMPWPAGRSGKSATWLGSLGLAVSPQSKNLQAAFDLIAYFTVNETGQRTNYQMGQAVPNIISMAKGEFLRMDKAPANRQEFLDIIDDYGRRYPQEYTYDIEWWTTCNSEAVRVWLGTVSAAQFCREWMFSTSLKIRQSIFIMPPQLIPRPASFVKYLEIWKKVPLLSGFKNSLTIAVSVCAVGTFTSSLAAFAFSKIRFPINPPCLCC